jgi:hypothetical protein
VGGMTCVPRIVETVKAIFCREPFKGGLLAGNVTDILFLSLITRYVISVFWHHKVDEFVGVETLGGIMAKLISQLLKNRDLCRVVYQTRTCQLPINVLMSSQKVL